MNLAPFKTPEGLEILIDRQTGATFANAKAIARMCSSPERRIDASLIRKYAETLIQSGVISESKTAEIETSGGIKVVSLYDEDAIAEFVSHYNLSRFKLFAKLGIRVYLHQLANYKASKSVIEILCIPEATSWQKRFPDEFYEHLYRLTGLYVDGSKRPGMFARLTKELIYDYLPPAVYWEIKKHKLESGNWHKLHQF